MAYSGTKERKKSSNFTGEEQELLMVLVRKYKDVVENKKSGQCTWDMKNNMWLRIEKEFNSQSKIMFRDAQALKTKFRNMKKECKQKFSASKKSILKTGGGPPENVDISNVDWEMKEIIGNTPVTGLPALFDDDADGGDGQADLETIRIEITDENGQLDKTQHFVDERVNKRILVLAEGSTTPNEIPDVDEFLMYEPQASSEIAEFLRHPQQSCDIGQTSQKTQSSGSGSNANWSQYSSAMLKEPVGQKLKVQQQKKKDENKDSDANQSTKKKKKLACTKSQLYEEVMQAKLDFIKLQREKFLEEHALRKKALEIDLELKKKQLLNEN